jgi:CubicO group peptidase (beta-lactamase class C family)
VPERSAWDGGLGSSFLVDPARDLVVIVLTQRLFDSPTPPAVHTEIQEAAYAANALMYVMNGGENP